MLWLPLSVVAFSYPRHDNGSLELALFVCQHGCSTKQLAR